MLPRRCKKCRCYIAPQLTRCPRCSARAPVIIIATKPTKEEKEVARLKRDKNVPVVHGKKIHWVPSALSVRQWTFMVDELKRRLAKADTARMRNTIRSEMRSNATALARTKVPSGKNPWTSETMHTKHEAINIFISPKNHRYVLATKDGPADLIIESRRKHQKSVPFIRLQRFEKSRYARMLKQDQRESVVHRKRKKAKTERRAKRRALKSNVE